MLKYMEKMEKEIEELLECFTTKLTPDSLTFNTKKTGNDSDYRVITGR